MRYMLALLCVLIPSVAIAGENTVKKLESKFQDWNVEIILDGEKILYTTHGAQIHQRKLGFIQTVGNCRDILHLEWSTWTEGTERFEGDLAGIAFKIGETSFTLNVRMLVSHSSIPMYRHMLFTNFAAGERLMDVFMKGKDATISIQSPGELVELIDPNWDNFSLQGFTAAQQKASELCQELSVALTN